MIFLRIFDSHNAFAQHVLWLSASHVTNVTKTSRSWKLNNKATGKIFRSWKLNNEATGGNRVHLPRGNNNNVFTWQLYWVYPFSFFYFLSLSGSSNGLRASTFRKDFAFSFYIIRILIFRKKNPYEFNDQTLASAALTLAWYIVRCSQNGYD